MIMGVHPPPRYYQRGSYLLEIAQNVHFAHWHKSTFCAVHIYFAKMAIPQCTFVLNYSKFVRYYVISFVYFYSIKHKLFVMLVYMLRVYSACYFPLVFFSLFPFPPSIHLSPYSLYLAPTPSPHLFLHATTPHSCVSSNFV